MNRPRRRNTVQATATDNCSTNISITYTDSNVAGTCADEETISRAWQATDECGNSSVCTQTITIADTTAPVITCPANVTVECDESTSPTNTVAATATDNCSTNISITYTDSSAAGTCADEETISRSWQATDECGNSSVCTQTITVVDTTDPVVTCPVNITIECEESTSPTNTVWATATDNCSTNVAMTYTDSSTAGTCEGEEVISRAWTAMDGCGNSSAVCTQTITVVDDTAPMITCAVGPLDAVFVDGMSQLMDNLAFVSVTDNCSTNSTLTQSPVAGTVITNTTVVTITATDPCGNSASCTITNYPLGEVSGVVWLDIDRDQNTDEHLFYLGLSSTLVSLIEVPCAGEVNTNLPMIVQTLMTGLEPNVVVDGVLRGAVRGFYAFLGVPFGCYEVHVDEDTVPLAPTFSTTRNNGQMIEVSGVEKEEVNFGYLGFPTAVGLSSFMATKVEGGVLVEWETGVEERNLGFYVYRAIDGGEREVVGDFIIATGNSESFYSLLDESAPTGVLLEYWLEDIDWDINRTMHGPVSP